MWYSPEKQKIFSSHSEIRNEFSQYSIPSTITTEDLNFLGLVEVVQTPTPEYNSRTHTLNMEIVQNNDVYETSFTVVELEQRTYREYLPLEFLEECFTEGEQLAVAAATMSSPQVKLWYDKMLAAKFVTYADPRTDGGLSALVGAGLLSPERKEEIVAEMSA